MVNPVLVEATRGGRVESRHRGAVAVVDGAGALVWSVGDIAEPVFPRSAVKAIQALPLLESGAADFYGFGARELTLAQASHGGEPEHAACARSMLAAAGLDAAALECGAHAPSHAPSASALAARGEAPSALHNNCSGKHAGFLALARHLGVDHRDYIRPDHPVQQMVREALEDLTGAPHGTAERGVDGCSIPTYAAPLENLAHGFARLATGEGLSASRAAAARRLLDAAAAEPFFLAGTGRFCTEVMRLAGRAVLVKTGAEGVFCFSLRESGLGVALKCDDGAGRASEAMSAAVLARLLPELSGALAAWSRRPLHNWRGTLVGHVEAVDEAMAGLRLPPSRV